MKVRPDSPKGAIQRTGSKGMLPPKNLKIVGCQRCDFMHIGKVLRKMRYYDNKIRCSK